MEISEIGCGSQGGVKALYIIRTTSTLASVEGCCDASREDVNSKQPDIDSIQWNNSDGEKSTLLAYQILFSSLRNTISSISIRLSKICTFR